MINYVYFGIIALIAVLVWIIIIDNYPWIIILIMIAVFPLDNFYFQMESIKLRLGELIGIITFLILLINKMVKKRRIILPTGFWIFFLFLFLAFLTLFYYKNESFQKGLIQLIHIVGLFIIALALYWLIQENIKIQYIEKIIIVIGSLYLLIGLLQFITYYLFNYVPANFNLNAKVIGNISFIATSGSSLPSIVLIGDAPWFRPGSILKEPVFLGVLSVWLFSLSISNYLYLNTDKRAKAKYLLISIFFGWIVIISASRIAWVALGISPIVALLIQRRYDKLFAINILKTMFIIIIIIIITFTYSDIIYRLDYGFIRNDIRWIMYEAQYREFIRYPILGLGAGTTGDVIRSSMAWNWEPENVPTGGYGTVISILHDYGLVGMVLISIFIWRIYSSVKKKLGMNFGKAKYSIIFYNGLISIIIWGIFSLSILGLSMFWLATSLTWASIDKTQVDKKRPIY